MPTVLASLALFIVVALLLSVSAMVGWLLMLVFGIAQWWAVAAMCIAVAMSGGLAWSIRHDL